jgi:hypothetical protein
MDRQLTEEAGDARNEAKYAIVFTRDYVNRGSLSRKRYKQGTIGFITRIYTNRPLSGISHVDVRIKDSDHIRLRQVKARSRLSRGVSSTGME